VEELGDRLAMRFFVASLFAALGVSVLIALIAMLVVVRIAYFVLHGLGVL